MGEGHHPQDAHGVPTDRVAAESGPAVATLVSDGSAVYVFFPEFGLVAYELDGGERWRLETLPIDASPAIGDGRLYVRTRSRLYAFGSGSSTAGSARPAPPP